MNLAVFSSFPIKQAPQITIKNVFCASKTIIAPHLQFITSDCRVLTLVNSPQNSGYWCCGLGPQQNHLSLEILFWEASHTNKTLQCSMGEPGCVLSPKL